MESLAFSQVNTNRKRFIALLWPNGDGDLENGNSTFHFNNGGLLSNLKNLQSNIIIPRGFSAFETPQPGYDGGNFCYS